MLFRNFIGLNWAVISSDFAPFLLGFPAAVNLKAKISDWFLVRRLQLSRVSDLGRRSGVPAVRLVVPY